MIKAIIYDCVGPILVKKKNWKPNKVILEIDKMCGKSTNDKAFWKNIKLKYNLNDHQLQVLMNEIAYGYEKNRLIWKFHKKIKKKFKTAIINNGTYSIFSKWIDRFQLDQYFDLLLNSAQLGLRKPNKKIFIYACNNLLAEPEECIFIDDTEINIIGANNIGMRGILYNPNNTTNFINEINSLLQ